MLSASFNLISAQTGPNDDFDGDGIVNSIDIDDDNDGILDINEGLNSSVNAILNGNFGTNGTSGGNITSWLTNMPGAGPNSNWGASAGGAVCFLDGAEGYNLYQNGVVFKTATTPSYATFTAKVFPINASGTPITQGWGKIDFYIETTSGLVRIFRVSNPLTATLASTTSDIELIDPSLVINLAVNGDYTLRTIATGAYSTITVNINTANLPNTGQVLMQRKNGTASGPNGVIGADDFYVDDVSYTYTIPTDTDNDGIPNHLDLDSDGDGCSDALEGGATTNVTANYKFTGPVGANGLDNTLETSDNGVINYTSTYNAYALVNSINACTDTDGDGVRDVIDLDDDNDGILDALEQTCVSAGYNTNASSNISNIFSQYGMNSGVLYNQLADDIGLVFSNDSSFAAGISLGDACGEPALAGLGWSSDFWIKSVNPTNITSPTPLKSITFKEDCAGNNEYTTYTAYDINGLQLYTYDIAANIPQTSNQVFDLVMNPNYNVYSIKVSRVANAAVIVGVTLKEGFGIKICDNDVDTDGDGVPNRLDLDSDGDGCPDAREAGVSANSGASGSMSASGGSIYTGGIPSGTASAYVGNGTPSQYGANGLFNGIETASESGIYNGSYTYQFAIGNNISVCTDTDGDGINDVLDVDDDNDGILDAVESPSCFYTSTEMSVPSGVTTQIPTVSILSSLYDNNASTTFAFTGTTAANALAKAIVEITPTYPQAATGISLNLNTATSPIAALSATATLRAEGWNGTAWVALATYTASPAIATNVQTFAFANTTVYSKYRLFESGTTGVAIGTNAIQEVKLVLPASYVSSANPKPVCTNDTDGDGIPNHRDLDSDGDGCPDAKEAGVSVNAGAAASMSASGGSIYTGGIPSGTANAYVGNGTPSQYGANGFFNGIETVADNGIYNGTYTYQFANNNALNACLDTDGDGVGDLIDIDDDNDGILDVLEQNCPNGSKTGAIVTKPAAINYTFNSTTLANLVDGTDSNTLAMYNPTGTLSNAEWFRVEFPYARILSSWEVGHFSGQTLFATTSTYKVQGSNDASAWTDLTGTLTYSNTQNGQSTQANNSNIANFSSNQTAYKYYRYYGISGTTGGGWATEFYFQDGGCVDMDTDNDGIPNRLDLDSDGDGDGCPDAREAGVSANTGASASMSASGGSIYTGGIPSGTANAYVGNGTPSQYGANGFFNGIETVADNGIYNGVYTYVFAIGNNISACTDTDGDGINDIIDIDDDNDGVPDAVESPACYYTASEWNAGVKPSYGVTISSALTTTTANFSQLIDGIGTTTAVAFSAAPTQAIQNANVYLFNFAQPARLDAVYLKFNTATQFAGTTKIQGSNTNNGSDWVDLSVAVAAGAGNNTTVNGLISLTNSIKYPVTLNATTAYKYIRITGAAASNIVAANASEVYFDFNNAAYVASRYPKAVCATDADSDGILNHHDLDSDGDGCSDALESGATTNTTANYQFPNVDSNGDGLVTAVDPEGDGIVNYTSTYNAYALVKSLNACLDTDGDGVKDVVDVDDDNDGVLDTDEGLLCPSLNISCETATTSYRAVNWTSFNATTNTAVGSVVLANGETVTVNYSGDVRSLQAANALAATAEYCPTSTTSGATNMIQTFSGVGVVHRFVFSKPVLNPVFQVWSLGAGGSPVGYQFTTPVSILKSNAALTQPNANTIVGAEGNGSIVFAGSQNEISFVANALENWSGLTLAFGFTAEEAGGCVSIDTDGDGIPNHLDLDSDGDGCPDALESGVSVNAGAFTSMSASGGAIYTGGIPSGTANAYVGNGTPSQYGTNGFFNGIETAADSGIYNGTNTYSLYALSSTQNVCRDTDGDNVPDVFDLDDDNDGVLDVVECPTLFASMTGNGGFSVAAASIPNWYMGLASASLPIAEPFTSTVIPISNTGSVYNYGIGGGNQVNSPLTGGLFDMYGGVNTATGLQYALQENDPFRPVVSKLPNVLVAGAAYNYSFDLGNRGSGTTNKYIVMLYNADTQRPEKIIESGALNTLPAVSATPSYKNFTGSFTPASSGNYYLLFYPSVSGGANDDFAIDRVAVVGAGAAACDTDNDGIPNYLDLDSDGDGCPDTKEAILYNHATEASIPGTVQNGSGGVVTSTTGSVPNAMVPGPYGNNGFADALQSSTNPSAYKYAYTYNFVADNINVSTCDNKFLYDMDSDDDGIPDAVESPTCFYTETQAMNITEGVTSDFTWAAANPLSNTYDDNTTYGAITPAVNIQNKALVTFDLPVIDATFIDYVQLNVGATAFGAGTWRLEGLDMMTNTWVSLSAAQAMSSANTNYSFINTLQPNTRYHTYRILGVTSVNNTDNARLTEFSIHYKNYNPSFHRTKMGCNSDGDNDGVPDYLDRDSDGDGCPDAVEAGIDKSLLLPSGFYNVGGIVNGDYVIVGGNYGNNGMSDLVETTPDSGIVNYVSTYNLYANNPAVNFCLDTDGDGVPDPLDIDDDNDGILDSVESPACFYTAAEANTIFRINSQFASPDDDQSDRDIQILHDGVATAVFNFNAFTVAENPTGSNLFTVEYNTPVRLATLSVSHAISATAGANAVIVGSYDGYNWSAALSPATLITATPINFVITTSVPYKYYKIQTGSVPGALAIANTIGEISSTLAANYAASAHPKPTCTNDTDGDGVLNHLDLDSDGDGCTDASESGTVAYALAQTGGQTSAGTVVNTSGTTTGVLNAIVGNNTPSDYSANGFYNKIESSDLANATYNGTYTYSNAINALIATCPVLCYKPAIIAGTILDTKQGITSLQRAGSDNDNWPMVRKGAWTALESKTKGFVPNRLTIGQINSIPAANLVEGMMVYNIDADCLYINTNGTATGWKCFNTQTCP